jgi:hypothetical protein
MVLSWRSETGARSKLFQICAYSRSDCDDTITALGLNSQLYGVTEICLYRRLTLLLQTGRTFRPLWLSSEWAAFAAFPFPKHIFLLLP